jgi:hypothetical protein
VTELDRDREGVREPEGRRDADGEADTLATGRPHVARFSEMSMTLLPACAGGPPPTATHTHTHTPRHPARARAKPS